jgi:2-polyprenyl-3-methyl-5-hydroxy-6-metoxy-1,4-benzoquinol methylase
MSTVAASPGNLPVVIATCPLCHGSERRELVRLPSMQWMRCACGLIYKHREQPATTTEALYAEDYFTSAGYGRRRLRRIAKSRHQILDALAHTTPGPLLDIGCSMGYALEAAASLGLPAAGTDVSDYAVEQCRKLGFRAERGTLDALPFADAEFAVVTMKHVLEHTPDPRGALAEVRRVLRPGGALFIAIPDARYHKAQRNPATSGFYLPERGGTEHFVYYEPRTLTQLLRECGFRTVRVHPLLVQPGAKPLVKLSQLLFAPLRALGQWLAEELHLRKEFWLVAIRD